VVAVEAVAEAVAVVAVDAVVAVAAAAAAVVAVAAVVVAITAVAEDWRWSLEGGRSWCWPCRTCVGTCIEDRAASLAASAIGPHP
jgi:hypothetical protein